MSHSAAAESAPALVAERAKDNLLGICHAIGEDFGFNPFFLRVSLAVAIIFAPAWTLATYAMMGVAVLASRLLVRGPRKAEARTAPVVGTIATQPAAEPELALAA